MKSGLQLVILNCQIVMSNLRVRSILLRRCPNAETLSRYEPPDCGAKGDYACAVPPDQCHQRRVAELKRQA
ncbi:hypothetical protein EVAR_101167_1 [Eumeta japonica]|uniref:Uncharacterized protein n=1 Tax=Eumeta variegata TaxID=151549 RepID=A0A4C1TNZ4_EUMVA|nr:hypothetical protein EVAR_101167_1 [Eumeta japonica]